MKNYFYYQCLDEYGICYGPGTRRTFTRAAPGGPNSPINREDGARLVRMDDGEPPAGFTSETGSLLMGVRGGVYDATMPLWFQAGGYSVQPRGLEAVCQDKRSPYAAWPDWQWVRAD